MAFARGGGNGIINGEGEGGEGGARFKKTRDSVTGESLIAILDNIGEFRYRIRAIPS